MSSEPLIPTIETQEAVVVTIMGREYPLRSGAERRHVEMVANLVNSKTRQVIESNPGCSNTEVAVLVSLNLADELLDRQTGVGDDVSDLKSRAENILATIEKRLPTLGIREAGI